MKKLTTPASQEDTQREQDAPELDALLTEVEEFLLDATQRKQDAEKLDTVMKAEDEQLSELCLCVRNKRRLEELGVTTLYQLLGKSKVELLASGRFGHRLVSEIENFLGRRNLRLR